MATIHAIFENGVFRPKGPVELPEHCEVVFEPRMVRSSADMEAAMAAVYAALSRSYETGDPLLAERHNEHQP